MQYETWGDMQVPKLRRYNYVNTKPEAICRGRELAEGLPQLETQPEMDLPAQFGLLGQSSWLWEYLWYDYHDSCEYDCDNDSEHDYHGDYTWCARARIIM